MCIGENREKLEDMRDVMFIEFALSNPFMMNILKELCRRKISVNSSDKLVNGHGTWEKMIGRQSAPHMFVYKGQICLVHGIIQEGCNKCCVWKFCVEEFDTEKFKLRTGTTTRECCIL